MPNKTIYVRDADLPLWEAAQAELKESISALFSEFLRQRIKKMDTFIHVLHADPPGSTTRPEKFAVMFAPVGPTGSGGAMEPFYFTGNDELASFLKHVGVNDEENAAIETDLQKQRSVSIRTMLSPSPNYRIFLIPVLIPGEGGKRTLLKVDLQASPILGEYQWRANFHSLDHLIAALESVLDLPAAQLAATRRELGAGKTVTIGGYYGDRLVSQQDLLNLGLVPLANKAGVQAEQWRERWEIVAHAIREEIDVFKQAFPNARLKALGISARALLVVDNDEPVVQATITLAGDKILIKSVRKIRGSVSLSEDDEIALRDRGGVITYAHENDEVTDPREAARTILAEPFDRYRMR